VRLPCYKAAGLNSTITVPGELFGVAAAIG
jgi:hypothetical protein